MTQYERMINGLIYDTCDAEIMKMQSNFKDKLWEFNQLKPPEGFVPKAVALNSGLYRLVRGEELLLDSFAEVYFPNGGTDEEYAEIDLAEYVTEDFPPSFIMTAVGDFLTNQAKPFYDRLRSFGVDAQYHCYDDSENGLKHVFHIDIKLPEARKCNKDECDFFLGKMETQ